MITTYFPQKYDDKWAVDENGFIVVCDECNCDVCPEHTYDRHLYIGALPDWIPDDEIATESQYIFASIETLRTATIITSKTLNTLAGRNNILGWNDGGTYTDDDDMYDSAVGLDLKDACKVGSSIYKRLTEEVVGVYVDSATMFFDFPNHKIGEYTLNKDDGKVYQIGYNFDKSYVDYSAMSADCANQNNGDICDVNGVEYTVSKVGEVCTYTSEGASYASTKDALEYLARATGFYVWCETDDLGGNQAFMASNYNYYLFQGKTPVYTPSEENVTTIKGVINSHNPDRVVFKNIDITYKTSESPDKNADLLSVGVSDSLNWYGRFCNCTFDIDIDEEYAVNLDYVSIGNAYTSTVKIATCDLADSASGDGNSGASIGVVGRFCKYDINVGDAGKGGISGAGGYGGSITLSGIIELTISPGNGGEAGANPGSKYGGHGGNSTLQFEDPSYDVDIIASGDGGKGGDGITTGSGGGHGGTGGTVTIYYIFAQTDYGQFDIGDITFRAGKGGDGGDGGYNGSSNQTGGIGGDGGYVSLKNSTFASSDIEYVFNIFNGDGGNGGNPGTSALAKYNHAGGRGGRGGYHNLTIYGKEIIINMTNGAGGLAGSRGGAGGSGAYQMTIYIINNAKLNLTMPDAKDGTDGVAGNIIYNTDVPPVLIPTEGSIGGAGGNVMGYYYSGVIAGGITYHNVNSQTNTTLILGVGGRGGNGGNGTSGYHGGNGGAGGGVGPIVTTGVGIIVPWAFHKVGGNGGNGSNGVAVISPIGGDGGNGGAGLNTSGAGGNGGYGGIGSPGYGGYGGDGGNGAYGGNGGAGGAGAGGGGGGNGGNGNNGGNGGNGSQLADRNSGSHVSYGFWTEYRYPGKDTVTTNPRNGGKGGDGGYDNVTLIGNGGNGGKGSDGSNGISEPWTSDGCPGVYFNIASYGQDGGNGGNGGDSGINGGAIGIGGARGEGGLKDQSVGGAWLYTINIPPPRCTGPVFAVDDGDAGIPGVNGS